MMAIEIVRQLALVAASLAKAHVRLWVALFTPKFGVLAMQPMVFILAIVIIMITKKAFLIFYIIPYEKDPFIFRFIHACLSGLHIRRPRRREPLKQLWRGSNIALKQLWRINTVKQLPRHIKRLVLL
jgi:hypothetical protein